ncbi:MAG: hypothetical protein ACLQD8_02765 [Thermoplasmata archaeon]
MTTNLRVSLTILSIGFAIEGAGDVYSFVSGGKFHPGVNLLFFLPVAMTLAGLLFVWIGRHEWSELHRTRVRQAHLVFGLSVLGGVVAGAVVGLLYLEPGLGVPLWAKGLFGAAVGSLVLGTFVTYVYLVFHLVGRPSQAVLAASIAWSLVVAGLISAALAANLSTILTLVHDRKPSVPGFITPVDSLASYLFLSYFLLLAAYLDAHRKVAAGPPGRSAERSAPAKTV